MKKILILDEDMNIVVKEVGDRVSEAVVEIFPRFFNTVRTQLINHFFHRDDVVMLTHDYFTDDMKFNLVASALYTEHFEYNMAGTVAFLKVDDAHGLIGFDDEEIKDVSMRLIGYCEYLKMLYIQDELE